MPFRGSQNIYLGGLSGRVIGIEATTSLETLQKVTFKWLLAVFEFTVIGGTFSSLHIMARIYTSANTCLF